MRGSSSGWHHGAALLGGLALVVATGGCKRSAPFYEDPQGRFTVQPFEAQSAGVDEAGTATRRATIAVTMPGGQVETLAWTEEAFADGSPDDYRWTLFDEKTGLRRVYTSSTAARRATVSDGVESHTATTIRGKRARLDQVVHRTLEAAADALAETPLCAATPEVFAFVATALARTLPHVRGVNGCDPQTNTCNTNMVLVLSSCRQRRV